jgi:hypothetical protein
MNRSAPDPPVDGGGEPPWTLPAPPSPPVLESISVASWDHTRVSRGRFGGRSQPAVPP